MEGSPLAVEPGRTISAALMTNALFSSSVLPLRILAPYFNSYGSGEHYGLHVDGAIRAQRPGLPAIRADVSTTVFLSDPDEYEGGELVVVDAYGTHEVRLPAGDAVVYPAGSVYQVLPVTQGERITSILWTQSMVREDSKRAAVRARHQHPEAARRPRRVARHGRTDRASSQPAQDVGGGVGWACPRVNDASTRRNGVPT